MQTGGVLWSNDAETVIVFLLSTAANLDAKAHTNTTPEARNG